MPHGIKDALLIYNPTSGTRRHRRFAKSSKPSASSRTADRRGASRHDSRRQRQRKLRAKPSTQRRGMVIACGGDGTINEIINGLAGSQLPMALLPAGTANILAKELGIPWDIPARRAPDYEGVIRGIALGLATSTNGSHSPACRPRAATF